MLLQGKVTWNAVYYNTSMFGSNHQHWRWSDYSALNVRSLTKLYLNSNRLTNLTDWMFLYMESLTELDLSANDIQTIAPNTFGTLQKLQMLHLDDNKSIHHTTFTGLKTLQLLDLSYNFIVLNAVHIVRVYLRHNKLVTLPQNAFSHALLDINSQSKGKLELSLAENQITCDKKLCWTVIGTSMGLVTWVNGERPKCDHVNCSAVITWNITKESVIVKTGMY